MRPSKYTPETKQQFQAEFIAGKGSVGVAYLSKKYGVSKPTGYNWVHELKKKAAKNSTANTSAITKKTTPQIKKATQTQPAQNGWLKNDQVAGLIAEVAQLRVAETTSRRWGLYFASQASAPRDIIENIWGSAAAEGYHPATTSNGTLNAQLHHN